MGRTQLHCDECSTGGAVVLFAGAGYNDGRREIHATRRQATLEDALAMAAVLGRRRVARLAALRLRAPGFSFRHRRRTGCAIPVSNWSQGGRAPAGAGKSSVVADKIPIAAVASRPGSIGSLKVGWGPEK